MKTGKQLQWEPRQNNGVSTWTGCKEDDKSCNWPSGAVLRHQNCCAAQNNLLFSLRSGCAAVEGSSCLSFLTISLLFAPTHAVLVNISHASKERIRPKPEVISVCLSTYCSYLKDKFENALLYCFIYSVLREITTIVISKCKFLQLSSTAHSSS